MELPQNVILILHNIIMQTTVQKMSKKCTGCFFFGQNSVIVAGRAEKLNWNPAMVPWTGPGWFVFDEDDHRSTAD